MSMISQNCIS